MVEPKPKKVEVSNLRLSYGKKEVIHGISFDIRQSEIFAIIGPAQSAKTSLLKCINRTLDFVPGAKVSGVIKVDGQDVSKMKNVYELRRKIGMVAPLPVGLPLSIYDNVAFAPRAAGMRNKRALDALVERCLTQAALWDEVKDRLDSLGTKLCLDEFSIAIDPVTTMRIEEVLKQLREKITIILVTNLVQQARRLADRTMFLWNGEIVEMGTNDVMFSEHPQNRQTYEYVNGIFG